MEINIIKISTVVLLCSLLSACITPIQRAIIRGEIALYNNNYCAAFDNFSYAAKNQDPAGEYAIGYMYYYGLCIPRNCYIALQFIQMAAQKNYCPAKLALKSLEPKLPWEETLPKNI